MFQKCWKIARVNKKSQIEGQTTKWPKETGQKDKKRSKNTTQKTKDRAMQTPL